MAAPLISFRTDAALAIGTGHVMRCLTLADALAAAGAQCRFVCRDQPGHLMARIADRGHQVLPLPAGAPAATDSAPPHAAWLGRPWQDDARQTLAALQGARSDWLVVDHYAIDARWEAALRPAARRLMVIDDLLDRPHDCDLLLDQSPHDDAERRYRQQVPAGCELRLGPAHVLLRANFDHPALRPRDGMVRRLFVYFGGNDRHDLAGQALRALARFPALQADIVLGADHPHRAAVHAAAAGRPGLRVHDQLVDMASAMAAADLALGVCGMAAWERCAVGLPSLVCINADNQRADSLALERLGAVSCLGDAAALDADHLAAAIDRAIGDPARIAAMGRAAAALVAGHTAHRHALLDRLLTPAA
jgi:UDP-2,4-diacetamido-2,4,6-trideoxy-beta-L-altropyranose hydrolase